MSEAKILRATRGASTRERMKIRRKMRLVLHDKAAPATRRSKRAARQIIVDDVMAARTSRLRPGMFDWMISAEPWPSDQPELSGRP